MTTSEVHSSPAAQWLQSLLAKGAPSQAGSRSNNGSTELPRDSTSISAQAFQLNQAAGASLNKDSRGAPSAGVSAAHHRHHHHGSDNQAGDKSFVSNAAQAIVSDLPRGTGSGAPASSANDLRVAYSHVTASEAASPISGSRPISVTA